MKPLNFTNAGYAIVENETSEMGVSANLSLKEAGGSVAPQLGPDANTLKFEATYQTDSRMRITVTNNEQFEVPHDVVPRNKPHAADVTTANGRLYDQLQLSSGTDNNFHFQIKRKSTGTTVFSTANFPLVFKEQFISIGTSMRSNHATYGLGESTRNALRLQPGAVHTMWNRDHTCMDVDVNLYGSHPFYLSVEEDGNAHGVLFMTSNAADFRVEDESLHAILTGGMLEIYVMLGPSPEDVMRQYVELVGLPSMPPRWSLGSHQSKYGYPNVGHLREVVENYTKANLPLEVIWSDIDYMQTWKDFTWDSKNYPQEEVRDFVQQISKKGKHYVTIVDPGILSTDSTYAPFVDGMQDDVFWHDAPETKGGGADVAIAQVWPGPTAFPDFLKPNAREWWARLVKSFLDEVPVSGLWIDMNEPSNFCNGGTKCTVPPNCPIPGQQTTCCLQCDAPSTKYDLPPYRIHNNGGFRDDLAVHSLAPGSVGHNGTRHYDAHNMYGLAESIATHDALLAATNTRPFVLTRSTFVSSGRYSAHWSGDNAATWDSLRQSIAQVLNSNLFGIPMVGADICGFSLNTNEELCARWTALGAFYPFTRNHASFETIDQEPYRFPLARDAAEASLSLRYALMPTLETAFYLAHVGKASPAVAAPLFFICPTDAACLNSSTQFVLAGVLLVSPVVKSGVDFVNTYLPKGIWYSLEYSNGIASIVGAPIRVSDVGAYYKLSAPVGAAPPLHIRGGSVMSMYDGDARGADLTTSLVAAGPYGLYVALDEMQSAFGHLFYDDGLSMISSSSAKTTFVAFQANATCVIASPESSSESHTPIWRSIQIFGLTNAPASLTFNGIPLSSWRYDTERQALIVSMVSLSVEISQGWTLRWEHTTTSSSPMTV